MWYWMMNRAACQLPYQRSLICVGAGWRWVKSRTHLQTLTDVWPNGQDPALWGAVLSAELETQDVLIRLSSIAESPLLLQPVDQWRQDQRPGESYIFCHATHMCGKRKFLVMRFHRAVELL